MEDSVLSHILEVKDDNIFEIEENNELLELNIKKNKKQDIPTKQINVYLEEDETNAVDTINSLFIFIMLPFFADKKQKKINLEYNIQNKGIIMKSSLSSDTSIEGFKNTQPSDFERNIFEFIVSKFNIEMFTREGNYVEFIQFNIKEVLNYLGLKFSTAYYTKIEEAMYNLQTTTYNFSIQNKKAAGNIIREVYKRPLNLLTYEKIREKNQKTGKIEAFYRVYLDKRILEELKVKHYSIFEKENLMNLRQRDKVAERIYQFISMKRFDKDEDEYRVETLATVIPLQLYNTIRKKVKRTGEMKEYNVKQITKVLKRIEEAFKVLVEMDYVKHYRAIPVPDEKSWKINFTFGDRNCQFPVYSSKQISYSG